VEEPGEEQRWTFVLLPPLYDKEGLSFSQLKEGGRNWSSSSSSFLSPTR
jgi:hypothetical protein